MSRQAENLVEIISPESAEKLKQHNEKKENLEQTVENFIEMNSPFNIIRRKIIDTKNFSSGDHLFVQRAGYTHHGL